MPEFANNTTITTADPNFRPPPDPIHSCPSCSHWLSDGVLACPDCNTLTYGRYLSEIAASATALEREGKFTEAREQWRFALQWLPADAQQTAGVQGHIEALDARLQSETDRKARWTKRLGPLAPVAFFLLKAKTYFLLLFKFKFLLSLLAYVGLYWALFGWKFALGFTASIFIHEMGHYFAAKRRGLKVDLPLFLPGLGAYVRWYSMGVSRADLAAISLAGPLFGLATALGCWALYWGTHQQIFLVLANIGAWVNVLNLTPLLGLDGSQATFALSRMQRVMIVATCVLFFGLTASVYAPDSQNVHWLFLIVAGGMLWRCFTRDVPEEPQTGTLVYFLALFLALGLVLQLTAVPLPVR